jgi:putative tryptophan/tyrosine transport system substrate-binding protein
MKRREFITLLGGNALWPLAAHAQQSKLSRVGFLGTSTLALESPQVDALRQQLRELGHVEGENIVFEYRWTEGRDDRLAALAEELVRAKPDVIVTTGTPGTLAAKRATSTIPIVFASSANPVNAGLVASYARPGGNVTGFTILGPELEGKRVQLIKEAVPGLSRIGMLWNPSNPGTVDFIQQTRAAAAALDLTLQPVKEVRSATDFKEAFAAIAAAKPHAMLVVADRAMFAHRREIVAFAADQRLPTMYPYRGYVDAGGLMSYAPNDVEQFRRTAVSVDKILRGTKPADLPVEEPVRYELVINLKTAKAIGLDVPWILQQRADEVIE